MKPHTTLPINLQDLLRQRTVVGERIAYKAGWNPDAIIRTLCPFPSDFEAGRAVSRRYRNRRIGEFLKELKLTEGRATGIPKILKVMAANGSPEPVFETDEERLSFVVRLPVHPLAKRPTPEVTPEVQRVLEAVQGEATRLAIQQALSLKDVEHFRKSYLLPALTSRLVEMTLPDMPRSSKQRYRLTAKGQQWLASKGTKP